MGVIVRITDVGGLIGRNIEDLLRLELLLQNLMTLTSLIELCSVQFL